jgi:hypothetical protein
MKGQTRRKASAILERTGNLKGKERESVRKWVMQIKKKGRVRWKKRKERSEKSEDISPVQ